MVGRDAGVEPLTFVCCIEQGRLESQTLLMLQTLRRFGGALADAPVLAVVGRRGAPLAAETRALLGRLDVQLVQQPGPNPAPWFNYANKVVAVAAAQRLATTPQVTWLDSDVLIAGEPAGLRLSAGEDFAARCEFLPPAVFPDNRLHEPYWQRLCTLLDTSYEELPWLERGEGQSPVRMFFNSGVFTWRRTSGFAEAYERDFRRLLRSRLATCDGQFFTADQVILGPIVVREHLRWRHLSVHDHHMCFQSLLDGPSAAPPMSTSSLIHYSKAMQPPHRRRFLERLATERPVLHEFVQEADIRLPALRESPPVRLLSAVLRAARGAHWRWYARRLDQAPPAALSS